MKPASRLVFGFSSVVLIALFAGNTSWAQDYSRVRIVRLSFVEGTVDIQRPDLAEWATALTNTPIEEGFKLATEEASFAEVEFENASTARLGQASLLEFAQLLLAPSGDKVNRLALQQGYATFNFVPEHNDFYEVKAGSAVLRPRTKACFRVDVDQGVLQVKVFKGSLELSSPEGNGTIGHNTTVMVRSGVGQPIQLTPGITKDAWDEWVEERENRAQLARSARPMPSSHLAEFSDLAFGLLDLLWYGDWSSHPVYGYVWRPSVTPGWSPFVSGQWAWYPGFGYTWISGEPWGWLPYHYGNWFFQPGVGWCWIPGSGGGWSPGVVNWNQGPGWVGWTPRPPYLNGQALPCARPQGCTVVVNADVLRNGKPVEPARSNQFDLTRGRPVERPDIQPVRAGMLPGPARPQPVIPTTRVPGQAGRLPVGMEGPGGGNRALPTVTPGSGIPPATSAERLAGKGTIAPAQPGAASPPAANRDLQPAPSPTTQIAIRPATPSAVGQPGPRQNYPSPAIADSHSGRAGTPDRSVSGPGTPGGGSWGFREEGAARAPNVPVGSRSTTSSRTSTASPRSSGSSGSPSGSGRSIGSSAKSASGGHSSGGSGRSSGSSSGGHSSGGGHSSSGHSGGGGSSGGGGGHSSPSHR